MTLGYNKAEFITLPTPVTRLDRVSEDLGINLYMKRDDLTDFGTGGNKLRKLEYLVKDALDKGCTMLLTVGGAQTNHGRLTAAVAAKFGLRAAIIAVDPYPGEMSANLLLDGIMGCPVYLVKDDGVHTKNQLQDMAVEKVKKEWEDRGEKVYYIPVGGSDELGILGYYDCALEMAEQFREMHIENPRVVTTVGSLGTYMGLQVGVLNEKLPMHVTGVAILPFTKGVRYEAVKYYNRIRKFFDLDLEIAEEEYDITEDYGFGGYNNPVKEVREAVYYLARMEGIITDPCYTGKTFCAILDMARKGILKQGENVVMVHTGGIPGIYTKHHRIEMEKELEGYIHII